MTTGRQRQTAALEAANAARTTARLERAAMLADFANDARGTLGPMQGPGWRTRPGMKNRDIAREFAKCHPQPPILGRGDGYAAALRMLTELEQAGR